MKDIDHIPSSLKTIFSFIPVKDLQRIHIFHIVFHIYIRL